ncbi:MAG: hypothetical protein ACD_64C00114G0004 [uncultured bacterium]|nr:MAG: hypothetical protein ACD_64C00114G0004 [uncultured bacterium]
MKKTILLIVLLSCGAMTIAHEHITTTGRVIAPLLDDDDDEMTEFEADAFAQMTPVERSALHDWIAGRVSMILGWYITYNRLIRLLAHKIRIKKSHNPVA